ncbi:MAG: MoaD/ThiS family protein [Caldilineales bacterium]|nr:MoaD/ThiS family protein [Caldilineales bacterium]
MPITLRAAGSLKQYLPDPPRLEAAETVAAALAALGLPGDVPLIVLVNERVAHDHTPLHDGDEVHLVPVIGGGGQSVASSGPCAYLTQAPVAAIIGLTTAGWSRGSSSGS